MYNNPMEKRDKDENKLFGMFPQMLFSMLGGRNKRFSFNLDNMEIHLPNVKDPIRLSGKVTIDLSNKKDKS